MRNRFMPINITNSSLLLQISIGAGEMAQPVRTFAPLAKGQVSVLYMVTAIFHCSSRGSGAPPTSVGTRDKCGALNIIQAKHSHAQNIFFLKLSGIVIAC